jgi:hypothetical protein
MNVQNQMTTQSVEGMTSHDVMMNENTMNRLMNLAQLMATSKVTVPKHLQGSQGDCFAVILQATQWGMNPFAVAQKTHLIGSTLSYEAQLVNAVIVTRAPVHGRFIYEWFGDWSKINGKEDKDPSRGVNVQFHIVGDADPTIFTLTMAQVGTVRNSPLWLADPKQQLAYLAVKRLSRLYFPDVILGVYSPDEIEQKPEKDVTPTEKPAEHKGSANLVNRLKEKIKSTVIEHVESKFNVKSCIESINASQSLEDLKLIADSIPADIGDPEQSQIKNAYKARKSELSIVVDPVSTLPPASIDSIEAELLNAVDNEALSVISDTRFSAFTAQMTDADIDRLNAAYELRLDQLNA